MRLFSQIAAVAVMISAGLTAHATPISYTFDLSNVLLCSSSSGCTTANDIGTLSGTITTNGAITQITAADITSSKSGVTYTLAADTLIENQFPNNFRLTVNSGPDKNDQLQLVFTGGLKATGATITVGGNSYESAGGNHFVDGSVIPAPSPTPEPSSIALMGTGLLGLAGIVRRRYAA